MTAPAISEKRKKLLALHRSAIAPVGTETATFMTAIRNTNQATVVVSEGNPARQNADLPRRFHEPTLTMPEPAVLLARSALPPGLPPDISANPEMKNPVRPSA